MIDYLKSLPLYVLPHHLLSRIILRATRWQFAPWKNTLIRWFVGLYQVDLSEAIEPDARAYESFNAFFTRALRDDARSHNPDARILSSPVDGAVSQIGDITNDRLIQAKGRTYSVNELLGGDSEYSENFENGHFATLYLAPKDYHRIHMPIRGRLLKTIYVPGRLFSVAPHTTRTIPNLFARNERLVTLFETDSGPMAVILVGAIFVACIETVWGGVATPPHGTKVLHQRYDQDGAKAIQLGAGEELGRFNMGSTAILLFAKDRIRWNEALAEGSSIRMGQDMGYRKDSPA